MLSPPVAAAPTADPTTDDTPRARRALKLLRIALYAALISFVAEVALYAIEVFHGVDAARGYVVNSVAKDALFAALAIAALADLGRRLRLVAFIVGGHAVIVLTLSVAWVAGAGGSAFFPPTWIWDLGLHINPGFAGWLPFSAAFTAALAFVYVRASRATSGLQVLSPFEASTLAALAEVTLDKPALSPDEIARRVDARWAAFPADPKHKHRLRSGFWVVALLPLLWARPPLPWMKVPARRALVEKRLLGAGRSKLGRLRLPAQASIRFATQLIYMAYYNAPESHGPTGYKRFAKRGRPGREAVDPPLQTIAEPESELTADYVVIGSGAGGAIVASQLVDRGAKVLMLERGPYVAPSQMTEDEADMYARLYADGALQLSTDFSFQVLQGSCVGGGTVLNNAICFEMPPEVLREWQRGVDLDGAELQASYRAVRELVGALEPNRDVHVSRGVRTLTAPGRLDWQPLTTNTRGCLGCGDCNLGCRFNAKLSMIQEVLPDAQRRGSLEIVPLCHVERIGMDGSRAKVLRCRMRTDGRRLTVRANTAVVVAAGAVHSSRLLMRSGVGGRRVGRDLSANLAALMTGVFDAPQHAYDGLQMTHYVPPAGPDGHILETFFNPVMSQALIMPGWLGAHQRNMERYDRLMCIGALVRSTPDRGNRVRRSPHWLTGSEFDFTPTRTDVTRLVEGMKAAGHELFDKGATEVMPATFEYRSYTRREQLDELDDLRDVSDLGARTAHPQGGNAMSADPRRGVVDADFKVHGTDNLYVTDASVFPTPIQRNPQLTIMALAHLAGQKIV